MWISELLSGLWQRKVTAPVNVRIVLADGTEIPVDCCYIGKDDDGTFLWETVRRYDIGDTKALTLAVDVLPARTAICVHCRHHP
jgi:hypothetical protein